jgi:hypothetical protein
LGPFPLRFSPLGNHGLILIARQGWMSQAGVEKSGISWLAEADFLYTPMAYRLDALETR